MPSPSPQTASIYCTCTPVRCPETSMFDLDAMLRASTRLQDEEQEHVEVEATTTADLPTDAVPPPSSLQAPSPPLPGNYQHRFGHLVLWELGLAIEFPPGSTILLPSATVSHSNTTILDGEVRASFTQYACGGLFRWVDYGFQTEKDLKKKQRSLHREMLRLRPDRWKIGVSLYSTMAELRSWLP